jgi:hypothetical protein
MLWFSEKLHRFEGLKLLCEEFRKLSKTIEAGLLNRALSG